MKICIKCNIKKELVEFVIRKDSKDGFRNECKKCKNNFQKLTGNDKIRLKEFRETFPEIDKERKKKWYNKVKNNITYKENNRRNKINNRENRNILEKERKQNDKLYKLKCDIRCLIKDSFKRGKFIKNTHTTDIVGCSFEEFKLYIENLFENWMDWNNHGNYTGNYNETWQYDHIIPLYTAKTIEDVINLNHYSNIRPLCSKLNLERNFH